MTDRMKKTPIIDHLVIIFFFFISIKIRMSRLPLKTVTPEAVITTAPGIYVNLHR